MKAHVKSPQAIQYLKKLLEENGIGQKEIAEKLGISPQALSQALLGKSGISPKSFNSLIRNYPDAKTYIYENGTKQPELSQNARIITVIKNQMSIPLVHERAHAGYVTMWSDREWLDDLPTVFMDERKDGKYVGFEIVGDSMESESGDSIREGDIIIAKELQHHHWTNKLHIPGIFVIVINGEDRSGIIIKEVTKHDTLTGTITCHSYNSYNPDEEIKISDVVKIYYAYEHRRRLRRR